MGVEGDDRARQRAERFARLVFTAAGCWGLLIMTPLYFARDAIGRAYPPPITHPDVYYGFIGVTLAWQVAFLMIASDPSRFRTMIIAAILEKAVYVISMIVLAVQGQLAAAQAMIVIVPDGVLAMLFVAAFFRVPRDDRRWRADISRPLSVGER